MRILSLVIILGISVGVECSGQNLIGFDKNMIPGLVKKEMKGFNPDRSAKNISFNYLKFVNSNSTKTLIVFFDDKNISISTRLICEYSELIFMINELNNLYKKTGDNSWEYLVENGKVEVNLEKKEYYFVLSTKKK